MVSATAAMVVLLLLTGGDPSPVELRWRLEPGEQLRWECHVSIEAVSTVNKVVKKITTQQSMHLLWHVDGRDEDGNYRIRQIVQQLQWKLQGTDGRELVAYDSSAENPTGQAADIQKRAAPLLGKPLHLVLSPRGEIVQAAPSPELQQAMESLPNQESILFAFSAEGLTHTLRHCLPILPQAPVGVGAQWEQKFRFALAFGSGTQTNRYTLTQLLTDGSDLVGAPATAVFDLNSDLQWDPKPDHSLRIKVQQMEGQLSFNIRRGRLIEATVHQRLVTEDKFRDDKILSRSDTKMKITVR